ncbi:MAG: hypothetical protein DMD76_29580 [Candidatus Rokuibacteriota bacterium]|nr:MAG: hypothetical protein DMD76_29580 [Candidatus Rokubacteria bacterium]
MARVVIYLLAYVLAAPLTLVAVSPALAAPSLDEVIRAVESAYGRMTDLKAEFNQTSFNKSLNSTIPAKGAVYLKKGGKLRWEYTEPTRQEIVSDGKKLWVYTPQLNQVNVGDAPEALAGPAGSFLAGLGKVHEHFTVRFLNPAQPTVSDGKKLWVYTPQLNQVNVGDAPEALAGPAGSFLAGLGKVHEHFTVRFLNPAQPTDADGNVVLDLTPKQPLPTLSRLILALDPRTWDVRKATIHDQFENTVSMRFTKLAVNSGLSDQLFTFVPPAGVATVPMR